MMSVNSTQPIYEKKRGYLLRFPATAPRARISAASDVPTHQMAYVSMGNSNGLGDYHRSVGGRLATPSPSLPTTFSLRHRKPQCWFKLRGRWHGSRAVGKQRVCTLRGRWHGSRAVGEQRVCTLSGRWHGSRAVGEQRVCTLRGRWHGSRAVGKQRVCTLRGRWHGSRAVGKQRVCTLRGRWYGSRAVGEQQR